MYVPLSDQEPRTAAAALAREHRRFCMKKRCMFVLLFASTALYSRVAPAASPRRLRGLGEMIRRPADVIGTSSRQVSRAVLQQGEALGSKLSSLKEKVNQALPKPKFADRSRTVRSVEHLSRLLDQQLPLKKLSVKGDGDTAANLRTHPVLKVMRQRVKKGYRPGQLRDGNKIALAIEGGGMRGAVGAGMAHAVSVLGLNDAIDCVYGSSAGSIVGAYFVSRQTRATGIYRDLLPCAKSRFLDIKHLIPALIPARGLESRSALDQSDEGLLGPLGGPGGGLGEVFNLTFLLEDIMGNDGHYPLDWETFERNNEHQQLHVVAAAPLTRRSISLSQKEGHFNSKQELFECMKASMCVPGLAGPPQYLPGDQGGEKLHRLGEDWGSMSGRCEPLVDALLYEPIPYRQAVADGATHVLVLRTRSEATEVLGEHNQGGIWEHHICDNYFKRYGLNGAASFMKACGDKRIYAEDVLTFNSAAAGDGVKVPGPFGAHRYGAAAAAGSREASGSDNTYIMNMVPPDDCEVAELEMDREKILGGLRSGFAAAFNALATEEELEKYGKGEQVAEKYFSTDCLLSDYDFEKRARERLIEAGVKIYHETDRNSRLLKLLDFASTLAVVPIRLPLSLSKAVLTRVREKIKRRARRGERLGSARRRAGARAQAQAVPIAVESRRG